MKQVDYLTVSDVVYLAQQIDPRVVVRDAGLLDAAVYRPRASVFGQDAYPDLVSKAAALLQSLVANHSLVDANKRTGWMSAEVFLAMNDVHLTRHIDLDTAEKFTLDIAAGYVRRVEQIAAQITAWIGEER